MANPNNPWQGQFPGGQQGPPGYPQAPPGYPQPVPQPPAGPVPVQPQMQGGYPGMQPGMQGGPPQPVPVSHWPGLQQPGQRPMPVQPQGYPQNQAAPQPYYQQPGYPQQPAYPQQSGYPQPQPGYQQQPYQPQAYQQPVPQPVAYPNQGPQPYYPGQPVPVQAAPMNYAPQQPVPVQPYPAQGVQPYPAQPTPVARAPQPVPVQVAPASRPVPVVAATPAPVSSRFKEAAMPVNHAPAPAPARPIAASPAAVAQNVAAQPVSTASRPVPVSAAPRPIPVTAAKSELAIRAEEKDEEEQEDIEAKVVRSAPPWLVSLVIHMVAIIIMGLIMYVKLPGNKISIEVVTAEEIGVQLDDSVMDSPKMELVDVVKPAFSMDTVAANDPFAAPPQVPDVSLDGNTATDTISAPSIGMALSGREKGAKEALLGAYGGNKTTEDSVRKGLEWLKKNQEGKGTWSLMGPYGEGSQGENKVAATSMALLAFQGAGNTHKDGEFKKEVLKAWGAMLEMQDKDGNFVHEGNTHHRLYSQAQATIAICEVYGMTKDPKYKQPAQLAIDYACKIQAPEGGWRYFPGEDSDTSVTGWFVIALQSAMMAGLHVPSETLERINKYLDSVAYENGSKYGYKRSDRGSSLTMTAEALLCRQYLGWARNDPRLVAGVEYVNENLIRWNGEDTSYYWYYATQLTHHMEGEHWKKWNNVMREVIPKQQEKSGKEAGSWSPSSDRWASLTGGRLYQTCLCIYMLEVYYRHLPIYKWKAQ